MPMFRSKYVIHKYSFYSNEILVIQSEYPSWKVANINCNFGILDLKVLFLWSQINVQQQDRLFLFVTCMASEFLQSSRGWPNWPRYLPAIDSAFFLAFAQTSVPSSSPFLRSRFSSESTRGTSVLRTEKLQLNLPP